MGNVWMPHVYFTINVCHHFHCRVLHSRGYTKYLHKMKSKPKIHETPQPRKPLWSEQRNHAKTDCNFSRASLIPQNRRQHHHHRLFAHHVTAFHQRNGGWSGKQENLVLDRQFVKIYAHTQAYLFPRTHLSWWPSGRLTVKGGLWLKLWIYRLPPPYCSFSTTDFLKPWV